MNIPEDLSDPRQADYEALADRFGEEFIQKEMERLVEQRLSELWNNREQLEQARAQQGQQAQQAQNGRQIQQR